MMIKFYYYPWLLRSLLLCLTAVVRVLVGTADVAPPPPHLPGCQPRCGDVDIPYPFGIGDHCAIHPGFTIDCTLVNGTHRPFKGPFQVTKISVPDAKTWIKVDISWQCYDDTMRPMKLRTKAENFTYTPFRFSYVDNKIFVIGCNSLAYVTSESYSIGYLSECFGEPRNSSCSAGTGCCEVDVPANMGYFETSFNSNYNDTTGCGYVVVMEERAFSYSTAYRQSTTFWNAYNGQVPVVMDWTISSDTCDEAKNLTSYACIGDKSECVNTTNGQGYRCKCQDGYQSNPYVNDGCTDIDDCLHNNTNTCTDRGATCQNTPGNYTCLCPPGKKMANNMCMANENPLLG